MNAAAHIAVAGTAANKLALAKLLAHDGMINHDQVIVLGILALTGETEEIRDTALVSLRNFESVERDPVIIAACNYVRKLSRDLDNLLQYQKHELYGWNI